MNTITNYKDFLEMADAVQLMGFASELNLEFVGKNNSIDALITLLTIFKTISPSKTNQERSEINAILIFLLIYTMCKYPTSSELSSAKFFSSKAKKYIIFFLIIYFQLVLGAYTRHSNAGLACPDFPTCLGYWIPPYLSETVFLHLLHRFSGVLIFLYALFLLLITYRQNIKDQFKRIGRLTLLVGVQIALGIYVVVSKLAFSMTAIHLLVALLIIMIALDAVFDENKTI